ncbi:MerR family transcriptional regulator [Kribbella sp. CA-247076]|uniref:MerR family transcriptional regulator n=1 Tax=Kribbella sp. CA-247076 TaxID=3239941 RepID=UPI003D8CC045
MSSPDAEELTVGQAAALVGLSVRTLHHWDAVGLVRPSERTPAGYRVYSADDVARIHRVLVYRELGLPLAEIGRILDDPAADAREHLRRQRAQLTERISHLRTMVDAVDRMLAASNSGLRLTPQEQVEIFGTDWRPEWVQEAEDRWGDTKQWTQYVERTSGLTPDDWRRVAADTEALNADLVAAHRAGVVPGSVEANALAERHRTSFSRYFDCTPAMHACLARTFVSEPDYVNYFNSLSPGLADWLHAVIFANTAAHGVDPDTATWS